MEAKSKVKKYRKEDLTIVWEPKKCIHAAVCVKELPGVYDPNGKPWIKPENATVEQLKSQIDKCPSGALSYELNKKTEQTESMNTKVELMKNGPLLVKGTIEVKSHDGTVETKEKMAAFCRCGATQNKPYCDGSHKGAGFIG
ncbi:MAG: hypothetical protein GY908_07470 [Flavobacteriales bacterium]|nr:hypothetical protein [Flavobacteriales bacterium]